VIPLTMKVASDANPWWISPAPSHWPGQGLACQTRRYLPFSGCWRNPFTGPVATSWPAVGRQAAMPWNIGLKLQVTDGRVIKPATQWLKAVV